MACLVQDRITQLKPYTPGKPIEEVQRELGLADVVKLASNENPLGPSPHALQALQSAVADINRYPDARCWRLKQALAEHWRLPTDHFVIGNGSDEIIHFIGLTFLTPGEEVIQADPSFVRYESAALLNGAISLKVPLRDYTHDLEAMAERVSERTKIVFIANPNNPTGTMNTRSQMEGFLQRIPERVLVVVDEAYYEYVDDPDYPDCLEYVRQGRNLVVLRTFSKIYALAGLRVGYGMARPELIRYLEQVREPFNVNLLAQEAAIASLQDDQQVVRGRAVNQAGKQLLYQACERLGLSCVPTQANFVLIDLQRDSQEVFEALLKRGVIVRTAEIYDLPTHIRVTIGTEAECQRFVAALGEVLAELAA